MKRKFTCIIGSAVILFFLLVSAACKNGQDEILTIVSDLDLTIKIPVPVVTEVPVFSYTQGKQYLLEITWKDLDGIALSGANAKFAEGEIYVADAVISVLPGYTLSGLSINSFRHYGSTVCNFNTNTSIVTVAFSATDIQLKVDDFDLTGKIIKATRGIVPAKTYYGTQYWLNISWKETLNGTPLGEGAFKPSTKYTATALITDRNYIWPDGTITFTHSEADNIVFDPVEKTITLYFPETSDALDTTAKYTLQSILSADGGQMMPVSGSNLNLLKQARYIIFECTASGNEFSVLAVDLSLNSGATGWSEQWSQFNSISGLSAEEDETFYYVIDFVTLLGAETIAELMSLELFFLWKSRPYLKSVPNIYLVNAGDLNIPDSKWDIRKTGSNDAAIGAPVNTIIGFITKDLDLVPKD